MANVTARSAMKITVVLDPNELLALSPREDQAPLMLNIRLPNGSRVIAD